MVKHSAFSREPLFETVPGTEEWAVDVVEAARRTGRSLACFEGDTGQEIWTWSLPGESGPLFVTRRLALEWMVEHLEHLDRDI